MVLFGKADALVPLVFVDHKFERLLCFSGKQFFQHSAFTAYTAFVAVCYFYNSTQVLPCFNARQHIADLFHCILDLLLVIPILM